MAIHVIDAPMGTGKTSAMINHMRAAPDNKHFVFVTPFLTESERIVAGCPDKRFVSPSQVGYIEADGTTSTDYRSKLSDFKELVREGRNIATTHALFQRFDAETRDLIELGDYTLVMDEVCELIAPYEVTPYDAGTLSDKYITTTPDGHALWRDDASEYWGRFCDYRYDCDLGTLWQYHRTSYVQVLLPETFTCFKECYLMTYLFESQIQRCYFDLHQLDYDLLYVEGDSVDTYRITDQPREYKIPGVKDKVHIFYDDKLNAIGDDYHALARGWYERPENEKEVQRIQNNACNFFRHKMKASVSDCLWTCYKEIHPTGEDGAQGDSMRVCPKGYKKQYVSCNARATNSYKDRHYLAYLINLFPSPILKNFINTRGVDFNRDEWALSMMVQWIWRSAIRDGEEIWVYVPSRRMRTLLEQWLDKVNG
jgi:hypothetical protein